MRRALRILLRLFAAVVLLAALLAVAAVLILPTQWFRDKVRDRIVSEAARVSGGDVTIGSFRFDWKQLRAEVAPFVLRGREPAGEAPLFRADRVEVGLKIVSFLKRDVDIASLVIDRPAVNVLVDANGMTNIPAPRRRSPGRNPIERLIDLAIASIELRDGHVRYADRRLPLNFRADSLRAVLDYDLAGKRYSGDVSARRADLDAGRMLPIRFDIETRIRLEPARILFENSRLALERSFAHASGTLVLFPEVSAKFEVKAEGDIAELGKPLRLPQPHTGRVKFDGAVNYNAAERYVLHGKVQGTGLGLRIGRFAAGGIGAHASVRLDQAGVVLTGLDASVLGGRVRGAVKIPAFERYQINAEAIGLAVSAIARAQGLAQLPWEGSVSGPFEANGGLRTGAADTKAAGRFRLTPRGNTQPVEGEIEVAFDQPSQRIQLGNSYLATASSRLEFNGTLGERLQVSASTVDLADLLPALKLASQDAPTQLPVKLAPGGEAIFEGSVTGPLSEAEIVGDIRVKNAVFREQTIDQLNASVSANKNVLRIRSLGAGQGGLQLEGNAEIALANWRIADGSAISGQLTMRGATISKLLAQAGRKEPLEGSLSATVDFEGTASSPIATARLTIADPQIYGETYDRIRAQLRYTGGGVDLIEGAAEIGTARIFLNGAYTHAEGDWKNGRLRFELSTRGLTLAQVRNLQQIRPGIRGRLIVAAAGTATVTNGSILPTNVDGRINIQNLIVQDRPVGDLAIDASTRGKELILAVLGNLRGSRVEAQGTMQLVGDYPSSGQLHFSPIAFSTVQDLLSTVVKRAPLFFDGRLSGRVTFSGPARIPESMKASLEAPLFEVFPTKQPIGKRQLADLTLRNAGPLILEYDARAIHVRSANLIGRDTELKLAGTINLREKSPWDLRVNGNVNLAVLQDFREDLLSAGGAVVNATVRGSLEQPQLSGRMELANASFYLRDVPNGIDNANGVVIFDRNRANIEKLTAQTGGGDVTLSGFVGFGSQLSYRLQGRLDRVRVRYPEGVSTTLNASLSLAGSTERSLLSGVVTILRAGFNPRTDIGGLIAASAKPIATPSAPNEFLRGMSFDVQIETIPNLTLQTALTSDLQAEADLRLRGSAPKPVLLGRVSVNEGEVQFFGNKYTINRGEINFYNPATIEPVLDMDLETRVRGVVVNINFTGPLKQLNVSYRSDPPLQSSEIVALLAVGRAPGSSSSLAAGQTVQGNFLSSNSNTLLGQAISAPVSGRLQRFFGVSRLKIDPQLTGINAVPQARITIEQQISRNITLTYITNLSNAQQQIVRLEWDLNRTWSLVALREENGVFGVDFFYKKRFK